MTNRQSLKIYNPYQADFLVQNGCMIKKIGINKRVYIEFYVDEFFNKYMKIWATRPH